MKLTKTTKLATVGFGALLTVLAYNATAQTPGAATAPPKAAAPTGSAASATSNIPRHIGSYRGDKIDAMSYVPSCPAFVMGIDAAAIQESNSRAFVEGESRKFMTIRDTWEAHEDCLTENARRDIDLVRNVLGDTLSNNATAEAAAFNAMNTAATENVGRIGKLAAPKAPKAPRGAPPVAAPVAPVSTLSAWTPPTGRFVGTLSGTAAAPVYKSGCPDALGTLSAASFVNEGTREGFERLLSELRAMPDRINQVRTCRQENGQNDYEAVQKVVTDGVNAVFMPRKAAFEREYAAINFQINEHKKPGGVLAPPEMRRAPAKAAPVKTKAKKK
jgi:hypothetical protein